MTKTKALQGVLRILLLFFALVGTAALVFYWLTVRTPEADWRILAVGLLLSMVLGWWPWISLGVAVVLVASTAIVDPEPQLRLQIIAEIAVFWGLGLGWGGLARVQFHPSSEVSEPPPPERRRPASPSVFPTSFPRTSGQPTVPSASPRSSGAIVSDGWNRPPPEPIAPEPDRLARSVSTAAVSPPSAPSTPSAFSLPFPPSPPVSAPLPPLPSTGPSLFDPAPSRGFAESFPPPPPPRPAPPPSPPTLAEYGNESIYVGSLPDASRGASAIPESTHILPTAAPPSSQGIAGPQAPNPLQVGPPAFPEDTSVVPAVDFLTMELPVNTLLRAARRPSSSVGTPSSVFGAALSEDGTLDAENKSARRASSSHRPETVPGASWEHLLAWYNQFSWAPWTAEELEKRYHRAGVQVGWETLALKDVASVWKIWRQGCVPLALGPAQVGLGALEGFLRCESLGVLRHQGFPDLHVLSKGDGADHWLGVYHEVRGRMRGGEAVVRRIDEGIISVVEDLGLVGRPDRLAEIRGESDVVALVVPFSVSEGLSWTGVYAVAQYRLAQAMGVAVSGSPVVVNLPLPVWDERRQSRLVVVDDVGSENRRLEGALERFRRVLSGQVPPRPQTEESLCSGCGWRHFCPSYQGRRPLLDLASPPPQIAVGLR